MKQESSKQLLEFGRRVWRGHGTVARYRLVSGAFSGCPAAYCVEWLSAERAHIHEPTDRFASPSGTRRWGP